MKKLLLIVFAMMLVLLAGAAALSMWFGQQAEIAFNSLLQKTGRHDLVTISHSRYQRGWFSSTAEISFSIAGIPASFVALNKIDHGPFPFFRAGVFTPLLAAIDSEITATAPELPAFPPLKSNSVIYLAGNSDTRIQLAPYKITTPDLDLHWLGATLTIAVSANRQQLVTELLAPQLLAGYRDGVVSAKKVRLTLNSLEADSGLTSGSFSLLDDKIDYESIKSNFALEGLHIACSINQDKGQLNADATWQFQLLSDGKINMGPGVLTMQTRKLDSVATQQFVNTLGALDKSEPATVFSKTLEFAANQAPRAPELEITKLSIVVSGGEVSGRAKLILDGSGKHISPSPLALLLALRGDLELSIPAELLKQTLAPQIKKDIESYRARGALTATDLTQLGPDTIDRIIDRAVPLYLSKNGLTRLLVEEKEQYKLRVSLRRGQLLINNQPWHGAFTKLP